MKQPLKLSSKAKLHSGSLEEWNIWEKQAKQKSFRYWMSEEGLDYLQNIVYAPMTLLNAVRSYISNRFVVKTHTLTSHLKRGQWHEFDTRLLHSIFDELINFVETEFAHQFYIWTTEDQTKYHISWYRKFFRIGFWRYMPESLLQKISKCVRHFQIVIAQESLELKHCDTYLKM